VSEPDVGTVILLERVFVHSLRAVLLRHLELSRVGTKALDSDGEFTRRCGEDASLRVSVLDRLGPLSLGLVDSSKSLLPLAEISAEPVQGFGRVALAGIGAFTTIAGTRAQAAGALQVAGRGGVFAGRVTVAGLDVREVSPGVGDVGAAVRGEGTFEPVELGIEIVGGGPETSGSEGERVVLADRGERGVGPAALDQRVDL